MTRIGGDSLIERLEREIRAQDRVRSRHRRLATASALNARLLPSMIVASQPRGDDRRRRARRRSGSAAECGAVHDWSGSDWLMKRLERERRPRWTRVAPIDRRWDVHAARAEVVRRRNVAQRATGPAPFAHRDARAWRTR